MIPDTARQILGIDRGATAAEIRTAWKKQVKRYHPDRPGGSSAKLMLANEAYETLTAAPVSEKPTQVHQKQPTNATRPKAASPRKKPAAKKTEEAHRNYARAKGRRSKMGPASVPLSERESCKTKLGITRKQRAFVSAKKANGGFYVDPSRIVGDVANGAEHVASKLETEGRWLLFVVEAPMRRGANSVALPTGAGDGHGATVITFCAERDGGGRVPVDPSIRAACFPWADSVEIAFRAA